MAKWQRRLDLNDVWNSADVPLIAKTISKRLRKLDPLGDEDVDYMRDKLADEFEDLASAPNANTAEFDSIMAELYDWADTNWNGKKVCWIATF